MAKVRMSIASAGAETGALLTEYLEKLGLGIDRHSPIAICYGQPTGCPTALNAACGTDKIQRMKLMNKAGVTTIPWFTAKNIPTNVKFPVLARKVNGYGGTDIVPVFQQQEVVWRAAAGWDWFSEYIPMYTEYRVWVFRDSVMDVYEKCMRRPTDYKFIGRNFRNGFEFERLTHLTPQKDYPLFNIAIDAVRSIGLDFGAVDILHGQDGKYYVLEVNTAPGVLRSGAQTTLWLLAKCIHDWVKNGCPAR